MSFYVAQPSLARTWTRRSTSWCTCTMAWPPVDPRSKSTCGGRSTWPSFRWWDATGGVCGLWTWGADFDPSFPSQVQFHVTIGHTALSLYVNCDFPHWMHYSLICYAITFIVLFGNFYYQTYRRQQPRRDAASSKAAKAVANGALNGLSRNANGAAVMGGKDEKPQENSGRRKRKGRAKRD